MKRYEAVEDKGNKGKVLLPALEQGPIPEMLPILELVFLQYQCAKCTGIGPCHKRGIQITLELLGVRLLLDGVGVGVFSLKLKQNK